MTIHRKSLDQGITQITIENDKLNILDTPFLNEITHCVQELKQNDECAGVILTGAGRAFSAGINLKLVFTSGEDYLFSFMESLDKCFRTLFEFPKPLVGAINGHALAGGCIISSCCDYKIGIDSEKSKIGITELAVGVPFPTVPLEIMKYILPKSIFQEVFYFAQGYPFTDSVKLGLLDSLVEVDDLLTKANEIASTLVNIPPETFSRTKLHLREDTIQKYSTEKAKSYDQELRNYWNSEEQRKAISNFLNSL